MILFHGSNTIVKEPRVIDSNRYLEALKIEKLFNQYVFDHIIFIIFKV